MKLIEWPLGAFADLQSPFTICVFGKDPFGSSLDEAFANKNIGDRPIVIQRPKGKTELRHCHVVFVSSSEAELVADIVGSLQEGKNYSELVFCSSHRVLHGSVSSIA